MDVKTATSRLKIARFAAAGEIAFTGRADRPTPGARLRPDLNGLLLTTPAKRAVYLIDGGYRRWIRDAATLQRLFGRHARVVVTEAVLEIAPGTNVDREARLVRYGRTLYLLDFEPDGRSLCCRPVAAGALGWFSRETIETIERKQLEQLRPGARFEGPQFD